VNVRNVIGFITVSKRASSVVNVMYLTYSFGRSCELLYFTIHCNAPPCSQDIESCVFILQCIHGNQLGGSHGWCPCLCQKCKYI